MLKYGTDIGNHMTEKVCKGDIDQYEYDGHDPGIGANQDGAPFYGVASAGRQFRTRPFEGS